MKDIVEGVFAESTKQIKQVENQLTKIGQQNKKDDEIKAKVDKTFRDMHKTLREKASKEILTIPNLLQAIDIIKEFEGTEFENVCYCKAYANELKNAIECIKDVEQFFKEIPKPIQKNPTEETVKKFEDDLSLCIYKMKEKFSYVENFFSNIYLRMGIFRDNIIKHYSEILNLDNPFQLYVALKTNISFSNKKDIQQTVSTLEKILSTCTHKDVDSINNYIKEKLSKELKEELAKNLVAINKAIGDNIQNWYEKFMDGLNKTRLKKNDLQECFKKLKRAAYKSRVKKTQMDVTNLTKSLEKDLKELKSKFIDWKRSALGLMAYCAFGALVFTGFMWASSLALLSCAIRMLFPVVSPVAFLGFGGLFGSSLKKGREKYIDSLLEKTKSFLQKLNKIDLNNPQVDENVLENIKGDIDKIKTEVRKAGINVAENIKVNMPLKN